MGKIKVAHIITLLELGGAQQNTLWTCEHLNREKYEVILISGEGAFLDESAKKIPDLRIYFVSEMVREIRPWKDLLCLVRLLWILQREKPKIVHTHSSKAGILGRIAARLCGVPCIIHSIHGFGFNPIQNFFVRWLFIFLEKWCAKISHALIAVSRENIREGLKLGIGKESLYCLIRSGVDIEGIRSRAALTDKEKLRKELGLSQQQKVVLTVGPFKIQKNPLAYVRLAQQVSKSFPEVQFLMVGDGELRSSLEFKIESLGLKDKVKLIGWRKDVPEILSIADIFVLTSLWEGLPRAAVEALIVGKPVFAFAVNGLLEIVRNGENGYLFEVGEIEAMAKKIEELFRNQELQIKLSENAAKSIDKSFDIHQMVIQQEQLYEKLLIDKVI